MEAGADFADMDEVLPLPLGERQRRDAGRVLHEAYDRKLGPLHALDLQPGFIPPQPVRCLDIL